MIVKDIFKKKSVEEFNKLEKDNHFNRTLNLFQIISLGVGIVIGAGIFILTGLAAGYHAGPAVTLSFALAGLVCVCAGLCYAEFASMIYVSGSAYSYTYISFGRLPAFVIGIITILGYFFGATTAIAGWSGYLVDLLGDFNIYLPEYLLHPPGHIISYKNVQMKSILDLPSLIFTLTATFLMLYKVEYSARFTSFLVFLNDVVFLYLKVGWR